MTVQATRPGGPTRTRTRHAQRPCARCGRLRQRNRQTQSVLCADCVLVVTDLGELHLWGATS